MHKYTSTVEEHNYTNRNKKETKWSGFTCKCWLKIILNYFHFREKERRKNNEASLDNGWVPKKNFFKWLLKTKLYDVWSLAEGKCLHVTGIVRMSLTLHVRVPKRMTIIIIIIIIMIINLSRRPKTCSQNSVSKKKKEI